MNGNTHDALFTLGLVEDELVIDTVECKLSEFCIKELPQFFKSRVKRAHKQQLTISKKAKLVTILEFFHFLILKKIVVQRFDISYRDIPESWISLIS